MLTYSGKKVEALKGIQNGYTRVYQPPSFVTEFQIMHTLLPQGKTTTIGPFDGNLRWVNVALIFIPGESVLLINEGNGALNNVM
jgi:hypothetical protein